MSVCTVISVLLSTSVNSRIYHCLKCTVSEDGRLRVVALCSLVEVYQHFRGACCLCHHCPDDGGTIETSVNFYQITWCNNPEDSHLNTCHHENLKAHCTVSNVFLATHRDQ
jgi:hypothetical protein